MLTTKDLSFTYSNGPSFRFPDIDVKKGGHMVVLGESGKGKTTLLHLMAGMLKPTGGEVVIDGQHTSALGGAALDHFRGKNIGVIFQTAHFVDSLSVLDNLMLPLYLNGLRWDKEHALGILKKLQLEHKAHKSTGQLSVGEQQRVSIARAVIHGPKVILADEPTSALDDKNAAQVMELLSDYAAEAGCSLIIVTHDQRMKSHFNQHVSL